MAQIRCQVEVAAVDTLQSAEQVDAVALLALPIQTRLGARPDKIACAPKRRVNGTRGPDWRCILRDFLHVLGLVHSKYIISFKIADVTAQHWKKK